MNGAPAVRASAAGGREGLVGAPNFRDIGGYRTGPGGAVMSGRVFRSGTLDHLLEADVAVLDALGVRRVVDLRREAERPASTPVWVAARAATVRVSHVPIGGSVAHLRSMAARMLAGEVTSFSVSDMVDVYVSVLENHPDEFAAALRAIIETDGAVVVHCTAGKDRTGVAVALLLATLGVSEHDIVEDYALSQERYSDALLAELEGKFAEMSVNLADVRTFFDARAEVMAGLLRYIERTYGDAEGFLTDRAGLDTDEIAALRRALAVPDADAREATR